MAPWRRSGRNVTADNFFTSIPLAEDLLKDGLTHVGTIRSNKPHIPDAMKANSTRQVNSSLFGFNDQATLVSYVPKEKQAVLALSTMHHDDQVDGDAQKPEIILYYNSTKSGVDYLDHLATMYTCRRKVNRWPVALFGNVVDVGAVAAFIIWMGNFPQWKISEGKRRRRLFLSELANQLVMPHIRRRALTPTLQAPISKLKLLQVQERERDVTSALVASTRRFDWHAIGASSLYVHLTVFNKCCATIASRSSHKIFHALFGYLVSE